MRVTVTSLEYVAKQFVNGGSLDRNDVERLYLNGRHLLNNEQYARLERLYRSVLSGSADEPPSRQ